MRLIMEFKHKGAEIAVFQSSNSFGDQLLEFSIVKDKVLYKAYASESEGSWIQDKRGFKAALEGAMAHRLEAGNFVSHVRVSELLTKKKRGEI